ncbi:MAG: peptidase U32 family protein [Paenibacillaceae bacterium]
MHKPELVTTASSLEELQRVIEAGADAVIIGEQQYGMRLSGEFQLDMIKQAVRLAHERAAKVYIAITNIMDNETIKSLPDYLHALEQHRVDAIIFGDPSVLMVHKQINSSVALHWNTEMTATNYTTANFWADRGVTRAVLPRELNMEQIIEYQRNCKIEVQVQVHGLTNIYHSLRHLVGSYLERQSIPYESTAYGLDKGFYLIETERQELSHPVYEDHNGTHIMSADDICMLENLPELIDNGIHSFKIEGLLKSTAYNETVVQAYRAALDLYMRDPSHYKENPEWLISIQQLQDPRRELTYGFFYKEQVY